VTLSSNYFDIKMNVNLKRGLESMIRNTKQTTATIYKALITGMLSNLDDIALGNSCQSKLVETNPRIFGACKGIVN
jgi:predicted DNA-binding protein